MKENATRILQIENIVVERDANNYIVSHLQEAVRGKNKGEIVQRGQTYYATLNHAIMNVRERLMVLEYSEMDVYNVDRLIEAVNRADERMINALKW